MLNYQSNADLQPFNTLSIPTKAACFISVDSVQALEQVLKEKTSQYQEVLILGSGSNVILPDQFNGLVIHIAIKGKHIEQQTDTSVTVSIAAGENWHETVMWSAENDWYGIENLALIPGTAGAAPIQNIGAYGVELKDSLVYAEALNLKTGQLKRFSNTDCQFAYRESVFKRDLKNQWVIIRVVLELSKTPQVCIDYPALKAALRHIEQESLSPKIIAKAIIKIRQSKLPDPAVLPNAGSFFKNPVIPNTHFQHLLKQYPAMASFPVDDTHTKVAAGWLLEQDGWKGRMVGGVAMHKDQALVLTNPNHLNASNILNVASIIKASIDTKFNIQLEIEPMIIENTAIDSAASAQ